MDSKPEKFSPISQPLHGQIAEDVEGFFCSKCGMDQDEYENRKCEPLVYVTPTDWQIAIKVLKYIGNGFYGSVRAEVDKDEVSRVAKLIEQWVEESDRRSRLGRYFK